MDTTSLIDKLVSKKLVLTPMEAIRLQYLSRKGVLNEILHHYYEQNPYLQTRDAYTKLTPLAVHLLIEWALQEDPKAYKSISYAYELLSTLESGIGIYGYKCYALQSQLRSMYYEHFVRIVYTEVDSTELAKSLNEMHLSSHPLIRFSSYSYLHQKDLSFADVLAEYGIAFKQLIVGIDNILTLNYFLESLIATDELECLTILTNILQIPNGEEEYNTSIIQAGRLCCTSEFVESVLDENHVQFIELLKKDIPNITKSFSDMAKEHVLDILTTTINRSLGIKDRAVSSSFG